MNENKLVEEEELVSSLNFTQQARFRCKQLSLSKVDGAVTAKGEQKFQYLVNLVDDRGFGKVRLEEHYYDFNPTVINKSFEIVSENEKIKHNVVFSIDEFGKFGEILNKAHLERDWTFFRESRFQNLEFVEFAKNNKPEVYQEIVNSGDKQFSESYDLGFEYRANFFYMMVFDDYLVGDSLDKFSDKEIKFTSILFPNLFVPLKIYTVVTEENEEMITIRRRGELVADEAFLKQVEDTYDVLYQPNLKYAFSEYKIDFVVDLKFGRYSRIAEIGEFNVEEEVLNNLENVCNFSLKRVKT